VSFFLTALVRESETLLDLDCPPVT